MCGIVGYLGNKSAKEILFKGLKRLEYRGYDSAGIATIESKEVVVSKSAGKVDDLISSIQLENLHSSDIVEEFIADIHTIGDLIKNRDKINMEKTLKKIQKRLIQNRKDSFLKSHNLKTQLFENI